MRDGAIVGLAITGVVLVAVGVPTGIYMATAATSGVRGSINLHNQNEDATNRNASATLWTNAHKDVVRDIQALQRVGKQTKDGTVNDPQQFYSTAQDTCANSVATYNTLQDQPTTKDWKPTSFALNYDPTVVCTDTFDVSHLDN